MQQIVLDLYGGDNKAADLIVGAIEASNELNDISLVIVGDENELTAAISDCNYDKSRISFIDAKGVLTNNDNPMLAVHGENDYTLSKAFDYYKTADDAVSLISVGSTGAVLISSLVKLGLAPNVTKPALASLLPCDGDKMVCLVDCGANLEPTANDLVTFASLGSKYIIDKHLSENPAVALLSVGREDSKGSTLVKQTFPLLKESGLNFIGNIEPADIFTGEADVVVCDGFSGNMILKNTEAVGKRLIAGIKRSGGHDLDKICDEIGKDYNFNERGGAVILGAQKYVVKAHGCATGETIKSCIYQSLGKKVK
ncbi:MAG: hypothetical protein J6L81_00745 [Clostridia bacterium]|nr:hypothetical protein [Clostridia bacterium]